MTGEVSDSGWETSVELDSPAHRDYFEAALGDVADALGGTLSSFEIDKGRRWRLTVHSLDAPDPMALTACIESAAAKAGIEPPEHRVARLPPTDWVAEYRRRTKAVRIGRFFVWPSHHDGGLPADAIAIRLDAGIAFGTGGHESTAGCLTAFGQVAEWGAAPVRGLDMGCGSGILAIAIAKLWPAATVIACDNDPVAVRVAGENIAANGVSAQVTTGAGEGYAAAVLVGAGPFDVIAANILADPLRAMAGDLAARLAARGHAVLSGILASQADEVLDAHRAHGLVLARRIDLGEWATLILRRP